MKVLIIFGFLFCNIVGDDVDIENCGLNNVLKEQQNLTSFIVGGESTSSPGAWPWVCSVGFLETDVWEHQCGGTLVTYRHVLTAAHCPVTFAFWKKDDVIKVRCGDYNLVESSDNSGVQVSEVDLFEIHDGYKYELPNYDISILVLKVPLKATDYVRPICMGNLKNVLTSNGAIVLGWGKDRNGDHGQELKRATVTILDPEYCNSTLKTVKGFGVDLFCAVDQTGSGSGVCFGDSGGPIFGFNSKEFRYELKGIVNGGKRCGSFESPDIYTSTSVEDIRLWISNIIQNKQVSGRVCYNGEQCLSKSDCPTIENKYRMLNTTNSELKKQTILELKSEMCNAKKRKFCCEKQKKEEEKENEPEGIKNRSYLPHAELGECGVNPAATSQKIVGGKNALPGEFPFIAGITTIKTGVWDDHFLGSGTLISHWYVLTVAHLVQEEEKAVGRKVVLGEWDTSSLVDCASRFCLPELQEFLVEESSIYIHDDFKFLTFPENDIALMKLPRAAKTNLGVQIACLPLPGLKYAGNQIDVVGWGFTKSKTRSTVQQKVSLKIISNTLCQKIINSIFGSLKDWSISSNSICNDASVADACSGDSGAGLLFTSEHQKFVVGMVSAGSSQCGGFPGLNTRVSEYVQWIRNKIQTKENINEEDSIERSTENDGIWKWN